MKTITEYLDELKELTGSDYKSAKELKIDRSTIANIRSRNLISDETAVKVADYLKIDRAELLIAAAIARSNGEIKSAWEKISKAAGIAAAIALSTSIATTPMDTRQTTELSGFTYQVCILC